MTVGVIRTLLAFCLLLAGTADTLAANIKLLATPAFRPVAQDVIAGFEKTSGHKVTLVVDSTGGGLQRMRAGEAFDVVIMTQDAVDSLADAGVLRQDTVVPLAKVGMGAAVNLSAPTPNIYSVEALRQTLLQSRRVAYPDPVTGGVAGLAVTAILQSLGITTAIERRTILVRSGPAAAPVSRGEADIALDQVSELRLVPSVRFAGLLPSGVQVWTGYAGAITAASRERDAAAALMSALSDPALEPMLKRRGLEIP